MALLACIIPVVSWICQPLLNAMQGSLETAAQSCFSFLSDWVVGVFNSRRNAVMEVPASTASIVGAEETLSEIKTHLHDEQVGIIGIYGMGGVGKTTLLQKINNDFFKFGTRGMFDLVIWVTISKEIDVLQIQTQIIERLGPSFSKSESGVPSSEEERAKLLFQALSHKRFLLLLDDVWDRLDLATIGIPNPKGRRYCKIVFTTRFLHVCIDMDVDKDVKVKVLDETRSWELFCSKLRKQVVQVVHHNSCIQSLAKQVVHKCGGLPLALITVGKAMANRVLSNEWVHAKESLDKYAEQIRGVDQVLSCLKLSYDYLQNDNMRSALIYCAMYPEDRDIEREELIEYWVGEGLLDDRVSDHIDAARNRGHVLISNLQDACMLEVGIKDAEHTVRMHDAIRDMALWLNNNETDEVDKFVVPGKGQRQEHVRRIWMGDLNSTESLCMPDYTNAWTLLLSRALLKFSLTQRLGPCFRSMRSLRVLDLSRNNSLTELPVEIGLLVELRYLNLSETGIVSLPIELGNLDKLRQLVLEGTCELSRIPRQAIVGLTSLQVLKIVDCCYGWKVYERNQQKPALNVGTVGRSRQQLELSDLESLEQLQELHIGIDYNSQAMKWILSSNRLCKCTRYLCISEMRERHPVVSKGKLVWLDLDRFYPIHQFPMHSEDLFPNETDSDVPLNGEGGALLQMAFEKMGAHLEYLFLSGDPRMVELSINLYQLSCLKGLYLDDFSIERMVVLGGTMARSSSVQGIRRLEIRACHGLKELKLVGRFACLEQICLYECTQMKELVLDGDFPMLKIMEFEFLGSLRCIGRQPLCLPLLETIRVVRCPQLRSLPLCSNDTPKLKLITGEDDWWNALKWDTSNGSNIELKRVYQPLYSSYESCFIML